MKHDLHKSKSEAKKLQQQHNTQKGAHFPDGKNNVQKQIDNLLKYTSQTMKRLPHPPARYYLGKRLFSGVQSLANRLGIKFLKKRLIPGTAFFSFLIPVLYLLLGLGPQNANNKPKVVEPERAVKYFGQAHPQFNKEPVDWGMELQPSQTNAMTTNETLPAGTLIIAMDGALQDNSENRVRQAYGLAVHLLHADIPLKWIIDPNKTNRTDIDFSASARQAYPSVGSFANRNFRTGPIAIFPGYEAQAQSVINSFGNNIRVYELQSATTVNVHSNLTHKPVVLVEQAQNPGIHTGILSAAGLVSGTHYNTASLTTVTANSCVTIITVPHNDAISVSQRNAVKDFTRGGGNFFAQCAGVRGFQSTAPRVFTNAGFDDEPGLGTFAYDNPTEPSAQFEGNIADEGGSLEDFGFSTDPPGGTRIVHGTGSQSDHYKAYAGRIDGFTGDAGGYVHYLGGHDHDGDIDADRFYLNAVLRSADRPDNCGLTIDIVNAQDDTGTIDCGNASVTINVLANDNNPQGNPLTVNLLGSGSNGTFVNNGNGTVTYTGNVNDLWAGDQINYEACDGSTCDQATITITSSTPNSSVISGTVFQDDDANGTQNGGEPGQNNVTLNLYEDNNGNGSIDGGEPLIQTQTSNGSGDYSFSINSLPTNNGNTTITSNKATSAYSGDGNEGYGACNVMYIEHNPSYSYVEFDLNSIPVGCSVTSATIELRKAGGSGSDLSFEVRKVIEAWVEGNGACYPNGNASGLTWNNRPDLASTVYASGTITNSQPSGTLYSLDITNLVNEWVSGTSSNQGLAIVNSSGSGEYTFHSDDASSASNRPMLVVNYSCPISVDYIVQIDQSTLPIGANLTTPATTTVMFNSLGELDCNNNFGFENNDQPSANDDAANACEAISTNISVVANDDFGNDGPSSSAITIVSNASNGNATVNTNGTANNPTDDQITYTSNADFSGTDQVTYQICDSDGDCDQATVTITVEDALDPGTNGTLTICEGETVTTAELFSSLGGSPDAGGSWTPSLGGSGTYTYTHAATANCPATSAQVVVTEQPAPDAGTNGTLTICEGETVTTAELFSSLGGSPDAGGSWTPSLGGSGTYTYTVSGAPNCPNATAQVVVSEQSAPDAGTNGTLTICEGEIVTTAELFSSLGGSPDLGGTWSPALAGIGTYTYTVNGAPNCPNATAQVVVSEQSAPDAGTNGTLTICEGETVTTAELFSSLGGSPDVGGSWSPALAGSGTYTYTVNGAPNCPNATAQVVVSEEPALDPGTNGTLTICEGEINPVNLFSIIIGEDAGGTWTETSMSSSGVIIGLGTAIDFSAVIPGTYEYTYTHAATANCPALSSTATITVTDQLEAGADNSTEFCEGSGANTSLTALLSGADAGGTWMQTGGTTILIIANPSDVDFSNAIPDIYTFTYTHAANGACPQDQAVITVTVTDQLEAGADNSDELCEGSGANFNLAGLLSGADAGGVWMQTGGASFINLANPSDVDFSTAIPSTYVFTYTHLASGSCLQDQSTITVVVTPQLEAGSNNNDALCEGEGANYNMNSLLIGADAGGIWMQTGGASFINLGNPSNVDFSGATPSIYTFTYTHPVNGSCIQDQATFTITIEDRLEAGTNGTLNICTGETVTEAALFASLGGSPDPGGVWTPALAGAGTYTYTHTATANCPASSAQVVVSEMPGLDAGTNGTLTICQGETVTEMQLFNALGGTPDAGGIWTPALAGAGTYTYTHPAVGVCPESSAQVVVTEEVCCPDAPIASIGELSCVNGSTYEYSFTISPGATAESANGTINGNTVTVAVGTDDVLTVYNQVNCEVVILSVTSPVSCNIMCEQPDLTLGNSICNGATYSVAFTETTGATLATGPGSYTITGNVVSGIPVGTDLLLTATNPNDGACAVTVSAASPDDCGDPCPDELISVSALGECAVDFNSYSVYFTLAPGATLMTNPVVGTIGSNVITGIPAGTNITLIATSVGCNLTDDILVMAPNCCPDAPVASIGEVSCVNGSTYEYSFTISPGATAESANGTINGNAVTVAVGTDDVLTVYNQVNCEVVTLSVTSPANCNIMCEQPDLTLGNSICNGATYSVAFTETTGATLTTAPGSYTITGNVVSNIPIGTNLLLTATNPNDGACAVTVSAVSPDDCGDPCPDELISVSALGECAVDFNSYSIYFSLAPGATLTTIPLVGTIGSNVITGIPAGTNITLIATSASCNLTDDILVSAPDCCPDAPIASIGEVSCVNGSTYEYSFTISPGATAESANGTINGNTVTVSVGTDDVLTVYNQVNCEVVTLSVTSPANCNIMCEQPDLTLGNSICNGATYSVAFTETTGATLTTAPGSYTITGNVVSNIPIGTNLLLTATNPNDGACAVTVSAVSPDDCGDPCPDELISVSALGECAVDFNSYSVYFTLAPGATLTTIPLVGTIGSNVITGIPAGTDITLIATSASCNLTDDILVTAPDCCPDAPIASIGEVSCVNGSTYEYSFTISPGATAESANGTINGNIVTVSFGMNDVLTVYNQVNCEVVTLSVTSPVSCNIMCEQPDLTLGNSICNGATYSVAFTETTGATITTGPGSYTITGNVVSNIPIGTNLLLTATNPNDGACAITLTAVSPDDCGDPCPDELISVSALGECAVDFNSYSVYFSLAPGATLTTIPLVGTIGSNVITGIPAGTNITLIATSASCNLTDDILVSAPDCCPDAPIASIGEVSCVNGSTYEYSFTISPGATAESANGTINGNTVTVAVGTDDILTVYNQVNCEVVTLSVTSPANCNIMCEQPDLTLGNSICNGATYSVAFTETTGATITTGPGSYTITGNVVSNIPIGTNLLLTATNPNDGACAITLTAVSPDDCGDPCPDELISVSALGECAVDFNSYSVYFSLAPGATLTTIPLVGTIGSNVITGIPAGTNITLIATSASCNLTDDILVSAPDCCPDAPIASIGEVSCVNGSTYEYSFTISPGATAESANGTINGNTVTVSVGTDDVLTVYNQVNCEVVTLSVTSPVNCNIMCEQPDLTLGNSICNGATYSVAFTETTGATITTGPGSYTITGNVVSNIPIGTNLLLTATNPNDGACAVTVSAASPDDCGDPCPDELISVSALGACAVDFNSYSVYFSLAPGATLTTIPLVGTIGSNVITGIPAGTNITLIATSASCNLTDDILVSAPDCCPDAPIASIGEVNCVNGSTYEYSFTISPGATAESANGTINGNTVTVAVGTDDVLTGYNQVNCELVTLSVTSPVSCNIMCEQPDLTLGNSICNGATYSVAFTETTGATITTGPGSYTITGNVVSNIPMGTNLLLTATNPNDGACAITVSAVSPDDCGDPCPDELISVSALGECAVDFNSYSVYFTLAPGATLTTIPVVGTIGSNVITGIPAGTNITLIATSASCNLTDDIMVIAPNCACPGVNPPSGNDVSYCVGDPIPSISVTVPGGQTVDWYDAPSGGNLLASSTTTYNPGAAGTYYAEAVEISSGCTSTTRTPIVLSEEPVPTINVIPTDPTDCDISNGRIVITASGTALNLKYSINGGLSFSDNGVFIGLDPGSYDIVVMYGDCMENFGIVTLSGSSNPTVTNVSVNNPDDCDAPTGSITVTSSTPVFSTEYSIDGGQTWQASNIFTGLIAGFYEVYVRNSDGTCPTAGPVVVLQEPVDPILLFVTSTDPTGCDGTDGTITAVGGGGVPPYQFRLTGPNGLVLGWTAPVTEFTFTGLSEGKYGIAVRNSDGTCEIDPLIIQLDDVDQPTIVGLTTERSMCLAGGSATFYVDGGETLGNYQYSTDALNWTPATGSFTFTALPPGVNTLWVANNDLSCPVSLDVTIGNECLELEKTSQLSDTNMDGFIGAGDVITFSFVVTNTGDVPITSVNITDPQLPILSGFAGTLNPGDSYAGASATYTVTAADVTAGQYVNQAMASGQNPENMTVNDLSDDPNDPTDNDLEGDGEPDDPTITPIPNGQPSANDDDVSICEEESINVAVLANDNFGSNGPGVGPISMTVNPSNGVAAVNNNGTANDPTDDSIDYTPNPGFAGTDILNYEICDADGDCSTAILTITVEGQLDPGTNGTLSICVGETVTEAALFAALNGTPDAGGVWTPTLAGAGTYTYTHAATTNCSASSAQVVVTETPGLDAGTNGTLTICEGQTVTEMQLFNALEGSPDAGGIWTPALAGAGTYTYTHPATGVCPESSATVTVTAVDCSTVAINDINQTPVNVPVSGDVSTNDYDPQGDNQTITSALADTDGDGLVDDNLPLGVITTIYGTDDDGNLVIAGTVNLSNNGTYLFTPATDFSGDVPFEYTVTDDNSISTSTDDATVAIEVIPASDPANNEPPVANDDTQTTEQGIPVNGNVMDNDSDPDGDPITVTSALADTDGDGQVDDVLLLSTSTPIYGEDENGSTVLAGTIVLNGNGTYIFTPEPTYLGKVPVDYTISDPGGLMDSATLTILIQKDNGNATYANDDANVGPKDEIQTGNVLDNDNDPEGDMQMVNLAVDLASNPLVVDGITVNTLPSGGTLVIDTDGSYTYTPATDFVGTEIVRYSIEDDGIPVATDVATLYLTTLPVNVPFVKLNAKAMLQGALLDTPDGLMRDDLREDNIIPVEEPYTGLGFTHVNGGGGEMVAAHVTVFADNGNNSIVDWVLVELRDATDPAVIVATRAALIQRDGDIVDINGASALCFTQSTPASYYVAVRHRNHNGIMTANPIALDDSGVLVDFIDSNLDLFDTAPVHDGNERVLISGKLALWAGNTNTDNKIVFAGQDNDKDPIFNEIDQAPGNIFNLQTYIYPGYFPGDVNMDGRSIFAGQENDVDPIFNNVDGYPANIFKLQTYVIPEQLAE